MHTRQDTQGSAGNESKRMRFDKSRQEMEDDRLHAKESFSRFVTISELERAARKSSHQPPLKINSEIAERDDMNSAPEQANNTNIKSQFEFGVPTARKLNEQSEHGKHSYFGVTREGYDDMQQEQQ